MAKKKPPQTSVQWFGGMQSSQYEFDCMTIDDIFDYYFPEWRQRTGTRMLLCTGETTDGCSFVIFIDTERLHFCRGDYQKDFSQKIFCGIDHEKKQLEKIFKGIKSFTNVYDARFKTLIKDWKRLNNI